MIMTKSPARRLFDGCDAGVYTLPSELLELRAAVDHLAALPVPSAAEEGALRQTLVESTMAAARRGEDPPDVAAVLEARRDRELAELRRGVVLDAGDRLAGELNTATADRADEIIAEHLRPALERVMADARKQAAAFAPHGQTREALFTAPAKARQSYLEFTEAAGKYTVIRAARQVLERLGARPQHDELGLFSEVRNAAQLWPEQFREGRASAAAPPPWHGDSVTRLAWFVSHDADVWMPTPAQQDAAWYAVLGERLERALHYRQQLAASRASFG